MSEKEITGYIAWHPASGKYYKHDVFMVAQQMMPVFLDPMHVNKSDRYMGWEFRPCKIVFTDELVFNQEPSRE